MADVVIITGANSGIGFEATKSLIAQGYRVLALDISLDNLTGLGADTQRLLVERCDLRNDGDVERAVRLAVEHWGRVDALINNAAVAPFGRFEETPLDSVRKTFEVNLFGYSRTIAAVLPTMVEQRAGTIVNVASMLCFCGLPTLPAYASSKGAVEALTRSLVLDLGRHGIAVKLFHPPSTRTPAAMPLQLPKVFTGDPIKVGAALAASIGSRKTVIAADYRTAFLLFSVKLVPGLFGRMLASVVAVSQRAAERSRWRRPPDTASA